MGKRSKNDTPFAKILTQLMKEHKMTVRMASQIAEVPPSTLQSWRSGANPSDFLSLQKLCCHFGVSLGYMLTGCNDSANGALSIDQIFSQRQVLFDGFAKIKIESLIPKGKVSGRSKKD